MLDNGKISKVISFDGVSVTPYFLAHFVSFHASCTAVLWFLLRNNNGLSLMVTSCQSRYLTPNWSEKWILEDIPTWYKLPETTGTTLGKTYVVRSGPSWSPPLRATQMFCVYFRELQCCSSLYTGNNADLDSLFSIHYMCTLWWRNSCCYRFPHWQILPTLGCEKVSESKCPDSPTHAQLTTI